MVYVRALKLTVPPTNKRIKLRAQLYQIQEEVDEVSVELRKNNLDAAAVEAWDIVTTGVTLLQVLSEKGVNVRAAHKQMIKKNDVRGYYA